RARTGRQVTNYTQGYEKFGGGPARDLHIALNTADQGGSRRSRPLHGLGRAKHDTRCNGAGGALGGDDRGLHRAAGERAVERVGAGDISARGANAGRGVRARAFLIRPPLGIRRRTGTIPLPNAFRRASNGAPSLRDGRRVPAVALVVPDWGWGVHDWRGVRVSWRED